MGFWGKNQFSGRTDVHRSPREHSCLASRVSNVTTRLASSPTRHGEPLMPRLLLNIHDEMDSENYSAAMFSVIIS
ncbi:hypothetical protein MTR_7g118365 [Medicago truncatula]|uniref:Transmembrane protein n=1 Tax=Medicago truncatula TaxID=3880 RepID=A0A072UFZ7_MEDTR|nr:hypothetical protein MTR_7g118365 [Medicago truncatula]